MALIANGVAVQPQITSKPIIINGDMAVAQRSTSVTGHNAVSYTTVDRFKTVCEVGTYTVTQESLTSGAAYLAGFKNALRLDTTTAEATAGGVGDQTTVEQRIEGFNLQAFRKGTASAQPFTLAFWVKASKTGSNLQVNLRDTTNDRIVGGTYSIASADTWEHKVINFAADTTGAFADANTGELLIEWFLDGGSNYSGGAVPTAWEAKANSDRNVTNFDLAGNTANDWAITGVQLEVGTFTTDTIPPFQFESFADNLKRCQRYYIAYVSGNNEIVGSGIAYASNQANVPLHFPTTMRTNPSLDADTGTDYYKMLGTNGSGNGYVETFNAFIADRAHENAAGLFINTSDGFSGTSGNGFYMVTNNASASIAFDAEL